MNETENVEMLQLVNTSATDTASVDHLGMSSVSVSSTAVPQTGNLFSPYCVCVRSLAETYVTLVQSVITM